MQLLSLELPTLHGDGSFAGGNDPRGAKQRDSMMEVLPQRYPDSGRQLVALLLCMLNNEPSQRPSAAAVLQTLNSIPPAVTVDQISETATVADIAAQLSQMVLPEGQAGDDARALAGQIKQLLAGGSAELKGMGSGQVVLRLVTESLEASYQRGLRLYYGIGVIRNIWAGFACILRAAELGHELAMCDVGVCLRHGLGVSVDEAAALSWFRKASTAGGLQLLHSYAEAQYWGRRRFAAQGTTWTPGYCRNWFSMDCVPKDAVAALTVFKYAANHGHANSICWIGFSFYRGLGVQQDLSAAFAWFTKAAELGDAESMYFIAQCYQTGSGVPLDVGDLEDLGFFET
jgi:TPR repeat protein